MSKSTTLNKIKTSRHQRGQALVIVLAVLFIMLFIGGVFVAQVGRNIVAAGRNRETRDALDLAQAGIRYCDEQLMNSPEGADWRPTPTAPLTVGNDTLGITDPDYHWLVELGGFTRIPMRGGRALVRVTYEPNPQDPRSNLIKIESVGRSGALGNGTDPTVFVQNGLTPQLRREMVGYKQIGLTDYGRFITNKTRSFNEAVIGASAFGRPVATVLGDPTLALSPNGINNNNRVFGASVRSNASLKFVGPVYLYSGPRGATDALGNVDNRLTPEGVWTAGNILLEASYDVDGNGQVDANDRSTFVNQDITQNPDPANALRNSTDAQYRTFNGMIRDSSSQLDANGFTRSIPKLEPPVIDTYVGGVLRYREVTRNSGNWLGTGANRFNTGEIGWGRNIYVNNNDDLQRETSNAQVGGSYSLRADWLNPNAQFAQSFWQGPFYNPPGVLVELLGNRIRLTRSDDRQFLLPDGSASNVQGGKVIEIPLTDVERANYTLPNGTAFPLPPLPHDSDVAGDPNKPYADRDSYGVNLVMMAEGNVRVKGAFGAITNRTVSGETLTNLKLGRVHLTIVSGGTAYVEGNLVKGDGSTDGANVNLERGSSLAVLAKDYVCVNTTKFMMPQNQVNVWTRFAQGLDAFNVELGQSRSTFDYSFSWGTDPRNYQTAGGSSPLFLMLRHAAMAPGPTFINMLVNPGLSNANGLSGFYPFNAPNTVMPVQTYVLGAKFFNTGATASIPTTNPSAIAPRFEQKSFPLSGLTDFTLQGSPGADNFLRLMMDQASLDPDANLIDPVTGQPLQYNLREVFSGGSTEYLLGGAAVVPMDIRIEAVLYAQEKSFFVIPGYTFNPDPSDTREGFAATGLRPTYNVGIDGTILDTPAERAQKDAFPFFGDPVDVRITINGAVAENYTASSGDQSAWMGRWGYIPTAYGSSNIAVPDDHVRGLDPAFYSPGTNRTQDFRTPLERTANVTRGLRFLYDPALALPYLNPTALDLDARNTRLQRALRAIQRNAVASPLNPALTLMPAIKQVLPPVPNLPVCPGLLYFGEPDRPIGS